MEQFKTRKQEVETEQASMKRSLGQLNQELARLAAETEQDAGARFDRIKSLEDAIRTAERRVHELSLDLQQMKENPVDPAHLRKTIREFEEMWATLTTREQEETGQTARLKGGVRRRDRQGHGQFPQCRSKRAMPRKSRVAEDAREHSSRDDDSCAPYRACQRDGEGQGTGRARAAIAADSARDPADGARHQVSGHGGPRRGPRLRRLGPPGPRDRARMSQIMNLLLLAPDIQERLLFLQDTSDECSTTERDIRKVANAVVWSAQRRFWPPQRDAVGHQTST